MFSLVYTTYHLKEKYETHCRALQNLEEEETFYGVKKTLLSKADKTFSRKKKYRQISLLEKSFKIFCKENPEIHKEDNTVEYL